MTQYIFCHLSMCVGRHLKDKISSLKEELPAYVATSIDVDPFDQHLRMMERQQSRTSALVFSCTEVFLLQPSAATAEWVFYCTS